MVECVWPVKVSSSSFVWPLLGKFDFTIFLFMGWGWGGGSKTKTTFMLLLAALANILRIIYYNLVIEWLWRSKHDGINWLCILFVDLGSHGESVMQTDIKSFTCPSVSGHVTTELVTVSFLCQIAKKFLNAGFSQLYFLSVY